VTTRPLHLRVFIASPGDVADERGLARKVIEGLPYDPLLRDVVTLTPVAWDQPGGGTPMLANMTPQAAIAQRLPRPSECDIVVVVLWSRLGTPLPAKQRKPNYDLYQSGTVWEYLDALERPADLDPQILVYRRTDKPIVALDDPNLDEKREQLRLVDQFFDGFGNPDGSCARGYNEYEIPDEFRTKLTHHLKDAIRDLLEKRARAPAGSANEESTTRGGSEQPFRRQPPLWQGSPFPGLRSFGKADAPIFFGRGRETDGLVKALSSPERRFLAVVGASGSGKSSLVAAGLLPRLEADAVPGSRDWRVACFTPGGFGKDPFLALAAALHRVGGGKDARPIALADRLARGPKQVVAVAAELLTGSPEWAELLLVADQFEELFTTVAPALRAGFIDLLVASAKSRRIRTVVTMRADFYDRCLQYLDLTELLRAGSYPLAAPGIGSLREMTIGPAHRAGLEFEEGLVERILNETGQEPGRLPLMAFALSELYSACEGASRHTAASYESQEQPAPRDHERGDHRLLTTTAYESFGGIEGAIGQKAESTFESLEEEEKEEKETEAAFRTVFRDLVELDRAAVASGSTGGVGGTATRRRGDLHALREKPSVAAFIDAYTEARLLVTEGAAGSPPTLEVAHEALFTSWTRLSRWIEQAADDLRLWRQVQAAAADWEEHGRQEAYAWPHERLVMAVEMIERLQPELDLVEQAFLRPEAKRLIDELDKPSTDHRRRGYIGERLAAIGDPRRGVGLNAEGLPELEWCQVPGGRITLDSGADSFQVEPFKISKYPVTWLHFWAFVRAPDGYGSEKWWRDLQREGYWQRNPSREPPGLANHPVTSVNWYEAVAFCRWLAERTGRALRLPAEWEWQQAATGGDAANEYPWGRDWDSSKANSAESGLGHAIAVGMYPHGASPGGALDMSGNVREWCLNEFETPGNIAPGGTAARVLRGGSLTNFPWYLRAADRCSVDLVPGYRNVDFGFRVAWVGSGGLDSN
jgi:hypothetical protein